jgi:hypothetical protein
MQRTVVGTPVIFFCICQAQTRIRLVQLPKVLVLHLKRYDSQSRKIRCSAAIHYTILPILVETS